ncbi:MAG: hypothetical protein U0175_35190 [Caldilineaceae bacterium]
MGLSDSPLQQELWRKIATLEVATTKDDEQQFLGFITEVLFSLSLPLLIIDRLTCSIDGAVFALTRGEASMILVRIYLLETNSEIVTVQPSWGFFLVEKRQREVPTEAEKEQDLLEIYLYQEQQL